jgi:hypothetical protein
MALLLRGGSVFLHIPKTGGSWVTEVLEREGLIRRRFAHEHAGIDLALTWLSRRRWLNRQPSMFCFVRHPLAWYESYYSYMSNPDVAWRSWGRSASGPGRKWHPNFMLNGCGAPEFNEFVRNVIRRRPGYVSELFGWYDKPPILFVGRQENLANDLATALRLCGAEFDEEAVRSAAPVNVSARASALEWDPAIRKELIQLEYAAIRRYGYEPA